MLEQRLLLALGVLFGVAALMAVVVYGGGWLSPVVSLIGHAGRSTLSWAMAAMACVGVSWVAEHLRRQAAGLDRHRA
jgi:hypothetical protein